MVGRVLVGGVVGVAMMTAGLSAGQPRFHAGIELVNVGVMALDKNGNFVTNLTARDFELFEEGQRQTVKFFSRGDTSSDAQNLHLGLLFDTSGSMTDDIELARRAAITFLKGLDEAQDITLVDFDTEVRVARYNPADFPRLVERIRQRKPDGWTALYDALGIYLDGAHEAAGRKVLVLYTDGGDTRSAISFADTLGMLRTASDVTVYAIGFLEHQSQMMRNEQRLQLQQIAELTGGQAFFPTSTKALDKIYKLVSAQIRAQYSLGFTPTNDKKDGTWRRLEVRLAPTAPEGIRLRYRNGYYAPLRQAAVSADSAHP